MKLKTRFPLYKDLKKCLHELYPDIVVELLVSDSALVSLGFVEEEDEPCIIDLHVTEERLQEIVRDALQLEVDAYMNGDPAEDDPFYQKYLRYGWLAGLDFWERVEE